MFDRRDTRVSTLHTGETHVDQTNTVSFHFQKLRYIRYEFGALYCPFERKCSERNEKRKRLKIYRTNEKYHQNALIEYNLITIQQLLHYTCTPNFSRNSVRHIFHNFSFTSSCCTKMSSCPNPKCPLSINASYLKKSTF